MSTKTKKSSQLQKCLNLALNEGSTEGEAIAAFRMARKLSKTHKIDYEKTQEDFSTGQSIQLGVADILSLASTISRNACRMDVLVEFDFSGRVFNPKLDVSYSGKKQDINDLMKYVNAYCKDLTEQQKPKAFKEEQHNSYSWNSYKEKAKQKAAEENEKEEEERKAKKKELNQKLILWFLTTTVVFFIIKDLMKI